MSSAFFKATPAPGTAPLGSNLLTGQVGARAIEVVAGIRKFYGTPEITPENICSYLTEKNFYELPSSLQDPLLLEAIKLNAYYQKLVPEHMRLIRNAGVLFTDTIGNLSSNQRKFKQSFGPQQAPKFYDLFSGNLSHITKAYLLTEEMVGLLGKMFHLPYKIKDFQYAFQNAQTIKERLSDVSANGSRKSKLCSSINNYYWVTQDMEYLVLDGATDVPVVNFAEDAIAPKGFVFFDKTFSLRELLEHTNEEFTLGTATYTKNDITESILEECFPSVDYLTWSVSDGLLWITASPYMGAMGMASGIISHVPIYGNLTPEVIYKHVLQTGKEEGKLSKEYLLGWSYATWVLIRVLGSFFNLVTSPGVTHVRGVRGGTWNTNQGTAYEVVENPGEVIKSDKVLIIDIRPLKHKVTQGTAGTGRKIHKRFEVRGHWRMQPYANGVVKKIWIQGYIKGPEGAPLVLRDKVFRLI